MSHFTGRRATVNRARLLTRVTIHRSKVYVDLYSAFYAKRLKCAQTWITQFYLQITVHHACLYSPAAEHHRPLAGTHFTIPRRVEG